MAATTEGEAESAVSNGETEQTFASHEVTVAPVGDADDLSNIEIISDSDEEGLGSTQGEEVDADENSDEGDLELEANCEEVIGKATAEGETECAEATEEQSLKDIEVEMKQYLPPPCPLEYAENPLLHMSPLVGDLSRILRDFC